MCSGNGVARMCCYKQECLLFILLPFLSPILNTEGLISSYFFFFDMQCRICSVRLYYSEAKFKTRFVILQKGEYLPALLCGSLSAWRGMACAQLIGGEMALRHGK
jgi:hypothetical protein